MTRDEILLLLGDLLGRHIRVSVEVGKGIYRVEALEAEGKLQPSDRPGWYRIGDASLNLAEELGELEGRILIEVYNDDVEIPVLEVALAEGVLLRLKERASDAAP